MIVCLKAILANVNNLMPESSGNPIKNSTSIDKSLLEREIRKTREDTMKELKELKVQTMQETKEEIRE